MKTNRFLPICLALGALALAPVLAPAQGTAFTFQGRLDDGGTVANGAYDLRFRLYNDLAAGSQVGSQILLEDVPVTNGLFTVRLDFGGGPFGGNDRWLQIAVRPGASTGTFTILDPRQALTPVPYAIYSGGADAGGVTGTLPGSALAGVALNATNLSSGTVADARLSANVALRAGGNTFSGNQVIASGNVGIGTPTPAAKLDVSGTFQAGNAHGQFNFVNYGPDGGGRTLLGVLSTVPGTNWPQLRFERAGGGPYMDIGQNQNGEFVVEANDAPRLVVQTDGNLVANGNVGIGMSPSSFPLSLKGTHSTSSDYIRFQDSDGTNRWHISGQGDGLNFVESGQADYRLYLARGGNVGIGTSTPATRLDVAGEVTMTACNITSDRHAKEEFTPVNPREILAKVAALPITEWQYKTQGDARHIGPMAQDFRAAFGTGRDDKHITTVDADGVALAAIQGLNEKVDEKDARIRELERTVAELKRLVERMAQPAGR